MHTHSILQVNSNTKNILSTVYAIKSTSCSNSCRHDLSQALQSKAEMTMEDIMWARLASMGPEANVGTHSVPMIVGFEHVMKKEKTEIFCDVVRMDG